MRFHAIVFLALALLTGATFAEEAAKPKQDRVRFGAVAKGKVFTAVPPASLLKGDLGEDPVVARRLQFSYYYDTAEFPPRWRLAFGEATMFGCRDKPPGLGEPRIGYMERVFFSYHHPPEEDPDSKDKEFKAPPGPPQERYAYLWSPGDALEILSTVSTCICDHVEGKKKNADDKLPFEKYEFFFDLLPVQRTDKQALEQDDKIDCVLFILTKDKLQQAIENERVKAVKKGPSKDGFAWQPVYYPEGNRDELFKDSVKPAIGVWKRNKVQEWQLEELIPAPFNERFHAFVKGTTYFFLTDSGKVYMAKKPDKGERKLESLWDNDKYPVVAALHDADADKVYLFSKAAKDDRIGTDFYWELDETVKRVDYEPSRVHPVKTIEPLKSVMELAQLLVDEKKIKLEKK